MHNKNINYAAQKVTNISAFFVQQKSETMKPTTDINHNGSYLKRRTIFALLT